MNTQEGVQLFLKARQAKNLSPQTIRWYASILNSFASMFPTLPDTPEAIEDFLSQCDAGDERAHGYFRALRALYRFLKKRYGVRNVVELVDAPKRRKKLPRPLTPQRLNDLLAFPHKRDIKAALLFLSDTGARVGECYRVTEDDFTETSWGHFVEIDGKTGKRIVPISPEVYHAMMEVIPFKHTLYRFRRLISLAFKDARIKGSGVTLRHTFCTLWDGDEMVLQRLVGHSHFTTTEGYRALRMRKLAEQHHQFSPLFMILHSSKDML